MDTRHLVDREILPMLDALPGLELDREMLEIFRAESVGRLGALGQPGRPPRRLSATRGDGSELELYLYDSAPGGADRPALYHIHGGGMVLGTAKEMSFGQAGIAEALGIPMISVEYRLAPETPFPGPQQDCFDGLAWLVAHAADLGIDPGRIAVVGESAGGGLAAATALIARDTAGPKLAGQVLIYPMLDHRTGGAGCRWANRSTGEFVWTRVSNQFGWECLRGDYAADDARKGWFSPALAEDLSGLPPTVLLTGSLDLFFDEDLEYARRLVDAGVPVELHSYAGAIHGFNVMADARISRAFTRDVIAGIARLLDLQPD